MRWTLDQLSPIAKRFTRWSQLYVRDNCQTTQRKQAAQAAALDLEGLERISTPDLARMRGKAGSGESSEEGKHSHQKTKWARMLHPAVMLGPGRT
jgi:hypothetical protein